MKVRLIDGNAMGFAQYFLRKKDESADLRTHALRGVLEHMRGRLRYEPDVVPLVLWDGRAQWRYDLLPTYKSGRHQTVEQREDRAAYEAQRPLIQKALRWFPVIQLRHPNAEADDTGFGLSTQLAWQGHLVDLSTSDTDWLGMVKARVRWLNARKLTEIVDLDNFQKATGFATPALYWQGKSIAGDNTDDIVGVANIAMKRAAALIAKYGDLERVLDAAEDIFAFGEEPKYYQDLMLPEVRARVRQNLDLVDLSRGPTLYGKDIEVHVGELEELYLGEFFYDHGMHDYLENWQLWEKALSRPISKADAQSVLRAVSNIHQSWPETQEIAA